MLLLVKCKRELQFRESNENQNSVDQSILHQPENDEKTMTFESIGYILYGKWGRTIVDVSLLSSQVGFCVVYVIFLGDSLHTIIPSISKLLWMFIIIPILILECWVRELKYLAPLSFTAVTVFFCGFIIVLYYSIKQPSFGSHSLSYFPSSLSEFATFVSIAVFSFEGIGLVLPVEYSLRDKKNFVKLFVSALVTITIIYLTVGMLGYISWGPTVSGSLMDNIVEIHGRTIPIKICNILFIIGGFCSYPLQMWPVSYRIEKSLLKNHEQNLILIWKKNGIRSLLVILSLALGIAIPAFNLFISLIGSIFSTILAFILPSLFHISLFSWKGKQKLLSPIFIKDVFILMFGIFSMITCTIVSIQNIAKAARDGKIRWDF